MRFPQHLSRSVARATRILTLLAGNAASLGAGASGAPAILDTQSGIQDGRSGVVLQSAPLSHVPIVRPASIASPVGATPNSGAPVIVVPYALGGSANQHQPQLSRPRQ